MLPVLLQVEAESARVAGIGVGLFVFITAIAVALVVIAAGQFTQSKALFTFVGVAVVGVVSIVLFTAPRASTSDVEQFKETSVAVAVRWFTLFIMVVSVAGAVGGLMVNKVFAQIRATAIEDL